MSATVYVIAGLAGAWVCLISIMWSVWGAPIVWYQFVGLFCSLALGGGAIALFRSPPRGQGFCACAVVGMGCFFVPASVNLVPAHSISNSALSYAIIAGYLLLVAAVFSCPQRLKFRYLGPLAIYAAMLGFVGTTYFDRLRDGEYDRPVIAAYVTGPSTAGNETEMPSSIPQEYWAAIRQAGITGRVTYTGGVGQGGTSKMIVIAAAKISEPKQLRYPKHDTVVYVWNGTKWTTIPSAMEFYPAFATVQTDGMITVELATGGAQSFGTFSWE